MAIVRSLAIGKAVNSAGNITYQTVKGRTIAREKPVHVANPNTPAQQAQRSKMSNIVAAWREWFFVTAKYFTVIQGYGSAYNEFVKRNIHLAELPIFVDGVVNSSRIRGFTVSTGKYSHNSIAISRPDSILAVSMTDIQMREDLVSGDEIVRISVYVGEDTPVLEHLELSEQDITTLKEGNSVEFPETGDDVDSNGYMYWSPSRRIASTCVLS